jgi:hypothetical protein
MHQLCDCFVSIYGLTNFLRCPYVVQRIVFYIYRETVDTCLPRIISTPPSLPQQVEASSGTVRGCTVPWLMPRIYGDSMIAADVPLEGIEPSFSP